MDRSDVLNEDNESFYDMINKRPTFKETEEAEARKTMNLDADPNTGVVGGV